MKNLKSFSLISRCLAIVFLVVAFLLLFGKTTTTFETEKWFGDSSTVLSSETTHYRDNYFEQIEMLNNKGFETSTEVFFLFSFGISLVIIIASIFVKFLRKIYFVPVTLITVVLCIVLITDITDGYVWNHDLIGYYGGYRLYEHTSVQFGTTYIPQLILSSLAFIAFCGAGIVEFITAGKKKVINAEFKESIENDAITTVNALSEADELVKFKNLLDSGIITQEEFDAKKKQLLGL